MTRIALVFLLAFVVAMGLCAPTCAQSYTFNSRAAAAPVATVAAANFTVNGTAVISNMTVTFRSTVDEDSDDESVDSQDDISDSSDSYDDSDSSHD
ncbi:hypothetical protein PF005_g10105 [Phytophthora fragariae]|uniref:RxLR effector protein n=1 Tax=Phytophthora fragariae TaxID=53985 RepID=A0A6A3Y857_9STRA|nr:hypothetical protein PF005_g10105 [Phytophthora fragariae]